MEAFNIKHLEVICKWEQIPCSFLVLGTVLALEAKVALPCEQSCRERDAGP